MTEPRKYSLGEIVLFRFPRGGRLRAGLVEAVEQDTSGWTYSLRDLDGQVSHGVFQVDIIVGNGKRVAPVKR